ncbi:hypothetical protein E2562_037748 [Oryza meyeriana var. granulata]|uniref:DUF4005 domain-containing protein n=1 Tax=Oryza meyeriana var. granulata TaxID=110450 RepID=A0A6G1FGR1_9ORYZ|nr:hypothetical protein E2562_037748 [Oryza meyeriana var. granulata]
MVVVWLHKAAVAVVRLDQAVAPAACPKPPAACPNTAATPAAHHNLAGAGRNPSASPVRVVPTRRRYLWDDSHGESWAGAEDGTTRKPGVRGRKLQRAREPFPKQPRGIPLDDDSKRRSIETQLSASLHQVSRKPSPKQTGGLYSYAHVT